MKILFFDTDAIIKYLDKDEKGYDVLKWLYEEIKPIHSLNFQTSKLVKNEVFDKIDKLREQKDVQLIEQRASAYLGDIFHFVEDKLKEPMNEEDKNNIIREYALKPDEKNRHKIILSCFYFSRSHAKGSSFFVVTCDERFQEAANRHNCLIDPVNYSKDKIEKLLFE